MRTYLIHDRDMGGFVSAFSQKMIKDGVEVVASTFCVSDARPTPPCSQEHQNEVDVYRLLCRLQGHLIPRFYGLAHPSISSSQSLHPITDYIPGIVVCHPSSFGEGVQIITDLPRRPQDPYA